MSSASNPAAAFVRVLKWTGIAVLALVLAAVLFIAIFGWNWLRGPIERYTTNKTGRVLAIQGDLKLKWGWPHPRVQAQGVSFANPDWAKEKQMLSADAVEITLDLPQLLARNVVFPEVRLERAVVFLEQGSAGRKSWLLDLEQKNEGAAVSVDRLTLDQGTLGYDDAEGKTRIRAQLSTLPAQGDGSGAGGVRFSAQGHYKGLSLKASGNGGPVLALRDETTPYPLKIEGAVGQTSVRADGSITSLLKFSAVDMRVALQGASLDQLYPLLGIAFPATRVYATEGHLVRVANQWRYEKFSGRIGASDIAGSLQVDTGGTRPALKAELVSKVLDLEDLGPLIGARAGSVQAAKQAALPAAQTAAATPARARVLPEIPFKTDRWDTVDADVTLSAASIRRAAELPLENLQTRLVLRDSVLTLDPLKVGVAGGQVSGTISLDGRKDPIQARFKVRARKILIAKLFPTFELNKASIGQLNGEFDLAGAGNSVGRMLATSNGKVGLVVAGGEISKLMMEKVGLHLWEILELNLTGDRLVKLRCAVADFDVKAGNMRAEALIFDTAVTTIVATGNVDLGQEKLNLTLNQKTKNTSPLALRAPIYVRGTFAQPQVDVDKVQVAARALGAIALGLVNPFLALIPLIDAGPGQDSDCGELVREARAPPQPANAKAGAPK